MRAPKKTQASRHDRDAPVGQLPGPTQQHRPDLRTQLVSLALCRPIVALETEKNRLIRDGSRLMEGIDTQYIALTMIDWIMTESFFRRGVERGEAIAYAADLAREMKPSLSDDEARRAGALVFDALSNAAENQAAFRIEYWDPVRKLPTWHEFRILKYQQFDDEQWLWTVTPEGLLMHLGMLTVAPELASEIERLMLTRLIREGKLEQAAKLAERARIESHLFHRDIDQNIFWAARGARVDWVGQILPKVKDARARIKARRTLDEDIAQAVGETLHQASEADRTTLIRVKKVLADCLRSHTMLDIRLNNANREYLEFQASEFALRVHGASVAPEADILRGLLAQPLTTLAAEADEITRLLSVPTVPRLFVLTNVLDAAMVEEETEDEIALDGTAQIEEYVEPLPTLSPETIRRATSWFLDAVRRHGRVGTDTLLALAERDELSATERKCVALTALLSFRDLTETHEIVTDVDGVFVRPEASGDRIVYTLRSLAAASFAEAAE